MRAISNSIATSMIACTLLVVVATEGESSVPALGRSRPRSVARTPSETGVTQSNVTDSDIRFRTPGLPCGSIVAYNTGEIGKGERHDLRIGCSEHDPICEGSFVLVADSNSNGVVIRYSTFDKSMFMPELSPHSDACGFDRWQSEPLGFSRSAGCPGTPQLILGGMSASSYSDTFFSASIGPYGCPPAAGVTVTQTVVTADGVPYNDFALYRWEIANRDETPKGPWHGGTWIDFDASSSYNLDRARASESANGYFFWNSFAPSLAFGMLDPNQPSRYHGTDQDVNKAYSIGLFTQTYCGMMFDCFLYFVPSCTEMGMTWNLVVNDPYFRHSFPYQDVRGDWRGLLINSPFSLEPYGSAAIHQAMFWVDASSNDPAIIEANMMSVAHRAARWAGFARGDVNDDGLVDLADVAWLIAGLPIYPDTYCGDVDTDGEVDSLDIDYLLKYVSGVGPAPEGEWRFTLPPTGPTTMTQDSEEAADTTNTR